MTIRFQADADLDMRIVKGIRRHEPTIDFRSAADAGLRGVADQEVLALVAGEGRILISHDQKTMPTHFGDFISFRNSPGVILISQELPLAKAIEEIILIWAASSTEEWENRIVTIPL